MRKLLNKLLIRIDHELIRKSLNPNPFKVQKALLQGFDPVVFDVGAHTGSVAMEYRRCFPKADIHCFEPFPETFELLKKNMAADSRVKCHSLALSDSTGTAVFHGNSSTATNSLLPTNSLGHLYWGEGLLDTTGTEVVQTMTVDDFISSQAINNIDILKLDVQGAEFSVLSGGRMALASHRIRLIYMEMIFCPTYEGQRKYSEYLSLMESCGYRFLDFYNPIRKHNQLIQADIIFINPELGSSLLKAESDAGSI
jgi:FkbM family methyltransferase